MDVRGSSTATTVVPIDAADLADYDYDEPNDADFDPSYDDFISRPKSRRKRNSKLFYEAIRKRYANKASLLHDLELHGCEGRVSRASFIRALMKLLPDFAIEKEIARLFDTDDYDWIDVDSTVNKLFNRLRAALHSGRERHLERQNNIRRTMALNILRKTIDTIERKNITNDETFNLCRLRLLDALEVLEPSVGAGIGAKSREQEDMIPCGR